MKHSIEQAKFYLEKPMLNSIQPNMPVKLQAQAAIADTPPVPSHSSRSNEMVLAGMVVLVLPVLIVLGILGRRHYRRVVYQRRVQMLERLWLLSSVEPRR
jgi:ABC-type glycerol-3-phosphate transport system permease component